jgi:uncharacterized protein
MTVDFKTTQDRFARYIRNPLANPIPPDVKPERMAMYRELIFNNIDGFLAGNFPVIRQLLPDDHWQALVQDFIEHHRSSSPYFAQIAEEFLDFLENERHNSNDYPFLLELAHYEWVEMALSIAQEESPQLTAITPLCLQHHIQLSPLAWPLVYAYPVHLISPEFIPDGKPEEPTCLVVYRDAQDEVKFSVINALTYRLLERLQAEEEPVELSQCLSAITLEFPQVDPAAIRNGGLQIMQDLIEKGIISSSA